MKTIEDINAYLGSSDPKLKPYFEDFRIIRIQDHQINFDSEDEFDYRLPHRRDFFEISIGLKELNALSITIGENQFACQDNNLIFASPIQVVSVNPDSQDLKHTDEGYTITFKPSFFKSGKRNFEILNEFPFFHSHSLPQYILSPEQIEPILHIANSMYDEYSTNKLHSEEILRGQLSIMLYSIKRVLDSETKIATSSTNERISAHFEREIIEDGIQIATLNEYASRLNLSPNYLSECVKKATGKSAKQILLSHKLIVAKTLLQQSDKNISQIADAMNFSEATNFVKFFKKMTGITPNQFRR